MDLLYNKISYSMGSKLGKTNNKSFAEEKNNHKCGCYIRRPETVGV